MSASTTLIKLLEIPFPAKATLRKDGDFESWKEQEYCRLLNQVLISQSLNTESAIQVIVLRTEQTASEDHVASLLRYLAEVHSIAWNEAITRKRPDVPLYVLCEALPGSSSLADLLRSLLLTEPQSTTQLRVMSLCTESSLLQTQLSDSTAEGYWSSVLRDLQGSLSSEATLQAEADTSADVLLGRLRSGFATDRVVFIGADACTSPSEGSHLDRYDAVAVGGTFDHLHPGHTLLLSVAASLCREELTIGVTSQRLLQGKKAHESFLCDYDTRVAHVRKFLGRMFPGLALDVHSLEDACGPAVTKPQLQAIVASSETLSGAFFVNQVRRERGMNPLDIVVVSRRDAVILSSSFIRAQLAQQQQTGASGS